MSRSIFQLLMRVAWNTTPIMVALISFATFTMVGNERTPRLLAYIHGRTVFLNTFQPSRDPSTGWRCHSTGAGGGSQY